MLLYNSFVNSRRRGLALQCSSSLLYYLFFVMCQAKLNQCKISNCSQWQLGKKTVIDQSHGLYGIYSAFCPRASALYIPYKPCDYYNIVPIVEMLLSQHMYSFVACSLLSKAPEKQIPLKRRKVKCCLQLIALLIKMSAVVCFDCPYCSWSFLDMQSKLVLQSSECSFFTGI